MVEYTTSRSVICLKRLSVIIALVFCVFITKAQVYYATGLTNTQKTFFQKLYLAVLKDNSLHKNANATVVSKASSKPAKPVLSKLMAAFVDTASIKSLPEFSAAISTEDLYQSQMMTVHCSNLIQKGIGCLPSKILFVMPVNAYGKIEADEEYYKGNENMLFAGIY